MSEQDYKLRGEAEPATGREPNDNARRCGVCHAPLPPDVGGSCPYCGAAIAAAATPAREPVEDARQPGAQQTAPSDHGADFGDVRRSSSRKRRIIIWLIVVAVVLASIVVFRSCFCGYGGIYGNRGYRSTGGRYRGGGSYGYGK